MRLFVALSIPLGLALVATSREAPSRRERARPPEVQSADELTARIDAALTAHWPAAGVTPRPPADDLAFARRLWLDLLDTVPSLQELRELEARPAAGRREWLVDRALGDPRFHHAFASRLVRVVVGDDSKVDDLLYRRRKLVSWMASELARHRPWDELARELIAAEGISTAHAPVNFVLAQEKDPIKLAARTTRAFLGVRIDCAQCHDHPFNDWKQEQFHGLAAFFARFDQDIKGVRERPTGEYYLEPGGTATVRPDEPKVQAIGSGAPAMGMNMAGEGGGAGPAPRRIAPGVPVHPELLPPDQSHRRRALAAWVTHAENPWFARAIANRLWGWLLGQGFVDPPDELDVATPRAPEVLELLARDLVAHRFQLERTVRAIVLSRAYGLGSRGASPEVLAAWAAFPLKQLTAAQLGAAALQTTSFWTYDERRAQLVRLAHFGDLNDFVRRHGEDPGVESPEAESLLQRLHLMNGEKLRERTKSDDIFGPVTRLPALTRTPQAAIEAAFLMTLGRRPTPREAEHFAGELQAAGDERGAVMSDLLWALVNSTEFAWNH